MPATPQDFSLASPPADTQAVRSISPSRRRIRSEALAKMTGGLRVLYRTLELPGANPRKSAHAQLDSTVLNAYGFPQDSGPKTQAPPDLLSQLLVLNLEVAAAIDAGESVTAPGVPPAYTAPFCLVTDDCITP